MNAYYEKNSSFNSNSRIFEGYFTETPKNENRLLIGSKRLLSGARALAFTLSQARVCRIAKAITVALSLVGFVGIIGAMDSGRIRLGTGLAVGLLLIGLEYLCLRGGRRQGSEN